MFRIKEEEERNKERIKAKVQKTKERTHSNRLLSIFTQAFGEGDGKPLLH